MSGFFYTLYTVLNLALLVWGLMLWQSTRRAGTFWIAAVAFGLMYDNLILSLGSSLQSSELFYWFSLPRFVLHQLVLPWIIFASFAQVRLAEQTWAQKRAVRWVMIALSLGVMLLGVFTRLLPMDLQLTVMDGVARYVDEGAKGPPLVSILSIGFAAGMGLLLWRRSAYPWLFLTALLVFITEGIPLEWVRRFIGSGAEVLFIAAMLFFERALTPAGRRTDSPPPKPTTAGGLET